MVEPVAPKRGRTAQQPSRGEIIRRAMREKGFSQSDLGRAAGINKSTVTRILNGSSVTIDKAERISRALGITLEELSPDDRMFMTSSPLSDGRTRFQSNMIVQKGVSLVLEAVASHDQPITSQRLINILKALHEPLP